MKKLISGIILLSALLLCQQAQAVLILELNTEFSGGAQPVGTPPWLTAIFAQQDPSTVRLTLLATNLSPTEFVDEWLFNFNPAKNPLAIGFNPIFSSAALAISAGLDAFPGDGGGYYDLKFDYPAGPPADRFGIGDVSIIDLILPGILESDFDTLSFPHGGNGLWRTAAHVQGIGTADLSGWLGEEENGGGGGQETPVPEPGTMILLGIGLAGLAYYRRGTSR